MRRPWTERDTEWLRRLYALGFDDTRICSMMERHRNVIRHHRAKLGKSHGRPGVAKGCKRSPEARARISEIMRQRWQDDREAMLTRALKTIETARQSFAEKRFRIPQDRKQSLQYRKLREALGLEQARLEMAKQ